MLKPWVLLLGLGGCELAGAENFRLTPINNQNPSIYPPTGLSPGGVENRVSYDAYRRQSGQGGVTPRQVSYGYDGTGRLTQMTYPNGTQELFENFEEPSHQPQRITLPGGVIDLTYDTGGRVAQRTGVGVSETFIYDVLGQLRSAANSATLLTHNYHRSGVADLSTLTYEGASYTWSVQPAADGLPDAEHYGYRRVLYFRDGYGRLDRISSVAPAFTYQMADTPATITLASGVVRQDQYDQRRRLLSRRYVEGNQVRAELRYNYDSADREIARQYIHRNAKTDFYGYNGNSDLADAELLSRPALGESTSIGWAVTPGLPGEWRPGAYGRHYDYRPGQGADWIGGVTTRTFAGDTVPPVAAAFGVPDVMGHIAQVDGLTRTTDPRGNVTLLMTTSGTVALTYDLQSRLTQAVRADGSTVQYIYRADGPLVARRVTCAEAATNCVSEHRVYIYDGLQLRSEALLTANGRTTAAQYYYAEEGDIPIAVDISQDGQMERYEYVVDRQGSVIGLLDDEGQWVERVTYDPWGQPIIEPADTQAPRLVAVEGQPDGALWLIFSEPVLPPAVVPAEGFATR